LGDQGSVVPVRHTTPATPRNRALLEAPPARVESLAKLVELGRARGYRTVALVPREGRSLESGALPRRSLILLGSEGPGLSANAVAAADEKVTILAADPAAESLNAAMAFALAAYAWRTAWAKPGVPTS
jgi:tRNA G18 (ribose-2'-O)-methylase SpoU